MKVLPWVLSILLGVGFSWAALAEAGGHVGGGDATYCLRHLPQFSEDGFYSLDYVLAPPSLPLAKVADFQASWRRIRALVAKNAPQALDSFDDFFASVNTMRSPSYNDKPFLNTGTRIWESAPGLLEQVDDAFIDSFPATCRFNRPAGKFGLWDQAVIRRSDGRLAHYDYEDTIVSDFFTSMPLQFSFLVVHEWLWDFYQGSVQASVRIRRANAFLHSRQAEKAAPGDFFKSVFQAEAGD